MDFWSRNIYNRTICTNQKRKPTFNDGFEENAAGKENKRKLIFTSFHWRWIDASDKRIAINVQRYVKRIITHKPQHSIPRPSKIKANNNNKKLYKLRWKNTMNWFCDVDLIPWFPDHSMHELHVPEINLIWLIFHLI